MADAQYIVWQAGGSTRRSQLKRTNIGMVTIDGENSLIAAVTNKAIRIMSLSLFASGTVLLFFNDGTTDLMGDDTFEIRLSADGSAGPSAFILQDGLYGHMETGDGLLFQVNANAVVDIAGYINYIEV